MAGDRLGRSKNVSVSKADCGAHERPVRAILSVLSFQSWTFSQSCLGLLPSQLWLLTDPGMFAIIYGGANGAMQSFQRRGTKQDEMLRIIAYVRTLDK